MKRAWQNLLQKDMYPSADGYGLHTGQIEVQCSIIESKSIYEIHLSDSELNGVKKGNSISYAKKVSLKNVRMNGENIQFSEIRTSADN